MIRSMKKAWATSTQKSTMPHEDGPAPADRLDLAQPDEREACESTDAAADCQVTVMSGSASREFPLGNQSVGTIRQLLKGVLNIADGAIALVNGQEVPEEHVVKAQDRVEFVRRAGSKGATAPADIVEIQGKVVTLKRGHTVSTQVGLAEFVQHLSTHVGTMAFPDGSPIPDGVRFIQRRGSATVVVIELPPQVRQVRWISARSPKPFGEGARYDGISLSFPYIVIIVLFAGGTLSGYQQLFYRVEPLQSETDALCYSNLLNVAQGYGLPCWLCLVSMADVSPLPWNQKVRRVVEHFWEAGFNRSSEHHEGNSYWQQTVQANLDPRISSLEGWAKATQADPLFMLTVNWQPAGLTIQQVVDAMLSMGHAPSPINTSADLIPLICASGAASGHLRLSHLQQALKFLTAP